MYRTGSFNLVDRTFEQDNNKFPKLRGSVGSDLHGLEQDRAIKTDPGEVKRRRTIKLNRNKGQSWGFTLQTYGIRNKRTREVEIMSYVDYVEIDGAAWIAGMRRGDIILSVNGESVELCTHRELVRKIQSCARELRLVVLFEDCCQKVELHERYLKLKRLLSQKVKELRGLEAEEKKLSQGVPLSRCDSLRQSTYSSTSSSDWDIYSEITSPSLFDSVPVNRFAFRETCSQSISDTSTGSSATSVDSLTSGCSFMAKNEDNFQQLKSISVDDEENGMAGSKFVVGSGDSFLGPALSDNCVTSSAIRTRGDKLKREETLIEEDMLSFSSQLPECEIGIGFIKDDNKLTSSIQFDDRLFSFIQHDDKLSSFIQYDDKLLSPIQRDEKPSSSVQNDILSSCTQQDDRLSDRPQHNDKLSSFLHNNSNRFSGVKLEDEAYFNLQGNLHEVDDVFSVEEAKGSQRCLVCGLAGVDENKDQMEQNCQVLYEVPHCFTSSDIPSNPSTKNGQFVHTPDRLEDVSCSAAVANLKVVDTSVQEVPGITHANHLMETIDTNNIQCFNREEQSENAQSKEGRENLAELICGFAGSCPTGTRHNSPVPKGNGSPNLACVNLDLSLDAGLCGACTHSVITCDSDHTGHSAHHNSINCQDNNDCRGQDSASGTEYQGSTREIKCQDSTDDTTCQDTSSDIKCQDGISNSECQNSTDSTTCQDSTCNTKCQDAVSDIKYQDSARTTRQADVSSKKRLLNGVLINDRSYITRL